MTADAADHHKEHAMTNLTYPLGNRYVDRMDVANPLDYGPQMFAVVVSAERTLSGNTAIRVGENKPGTAITTRLANIVLTPDEREALIASLIAQR